MSGIQNYSNYNQFAFNLTFSSDVGTTHVRLIGMLVKVLLFEKPPKYRSNSSHFKGLDPIRR